MLSINSAKTNQKIQIAKIASFILYRNQFIRQSLSQNLLNFSYIAFSKSVQFKGVEDSPPPGLNTKNSTKRQHRVAHQNIK